MEGYSKLSEKRVDDLYIKIEKMDLPKQQIRKLQNIIPSYSKLTKIKSNNLDRFNHKYNQSKSCVLCNERRTIEHCHILKRSFFKNNGRLGRDFRDFEWHPLNIVNLCRNHHYALDHYILSKTKIRKIIRNRLRLRKKYIKDLKYEVNRLGMKIEQIEKAEKRIIKYVKNELVKISK